VKKNPITYRQACETLGGKYSTIAAAADRGVLTKIPVTGPEQKLIEEQVKLFVGKNQLKTSALSREEYKKWEELEREALRGLVPELEPLAQSNIPPTQPTSMTINVRPPDGSALEVMERTGKDLRTETPAGPVLFHFALADETDNEDVLQKIGLSSTLALLILLGLIALFFLQKAQEVQGTTIKQVEKITRRIGLEREDLDTSQRKSVVALMGDAMSDPPKDKTILALKSHPKEALKLKSLLNV